MNIIQIAAICNNTFSSNPRTSDDYFYVKLSPSRSSGNHWQSLDKMIRSADYVFDVNFEASTLRLSKTRNGNLDIFQTNYDSNHIGFGVFKFLDSKELALLKMRLISFEKFNISYNMA